MKSPKFNVGIGGEGKLRNHGKRDGNISNAPARTKYFCVVGITRLGINEKDYGEEEVAKSSCVQDER
jgi:hypothetical protein